MQPPPRMVDRLPRVQLAQPQRVERDPQRLQRRPVRVRERVRQREKEARRIDHSLRRQPSTGGVAQKSTDGHRLGCPS